MAALRYVAIDLETTGLDPDWCQILELGAVVDTGDWSVPADKLPSLNHLVRNERIRGEEYALAMHGDLLREIAARKKERIVLPHAVEMIRADRLAQALWAFVRKHFPAGPVPVAGKNASGFDLPFLARLPGWDPDLFDFRVIDAGNLWLDPASDEKVPGSAECKRRAGLPPGEPHRALPDALAVVELVRRAGLARAGLPAYWNGASGRAAGGPDLFTGLPEAA